MRSSRFLAISFPHIVLILLGAAITLPLNAQDEAQKSTHFVGESDPARIHRRRGGSPPRAAPERRTKADTYPGTRIMIGTGNGGRSRCIL